MTHEPMTDTPLSLRPAARLLDALETRPCAGCGEGRGFIFTFSDVSGSFNYCPECSANMALTLEAQAQLERLLIPVVRAWAGHWGPLLLKRVGKFCSPESLLEQLSESFEH